MQRVLTENLFPVLILFHFLIGARWEISLIREERERERNEVEYGNWITGFVLGGLDNYKRNVTRETRAVISSNRNYVSRCRLFLRGIPWTIMSRAFRSCVNLSLEPVDVSRFKIVSNISIDFFTWLKFLVNHS